MTDYKAIKYNVSGADLTGLTAGQIPSLATSKITSGTFADARISSSSVTQHAATFDDTDLRTDIMTLALKEAITENRIAYNLPNAMIEQFQDDSKIGTETTGDRNASEYWTTLAQVLGSSAYEVGDRTGSYTITRSTNFEIYGAAYVNIENAIDGSDAHVGGAWYPQGSWAGSNAVAGEWLSFDLGAGNSKIYVGGRQSGSTDSYSNGIWKWQGSNDYSEWVDLGANYDWTYSSLEQETLWSNTVAYRHIRTLGVSGTYTNTPWHYETEFKVTATTGTNSATGTLISTANTANAAQTKVSGVILYKNNAGTATLGTDLKIYFTCNGGTNWTESTPTAAGTFSSGILMAKCPEVTCTSGTDVRYKAVWANQSAGSKDTQLHGIGVNY